MAKEDKGKYWHNIAFLNHFNCFAMPQTTVSTEKSVDPRVEDSVKTRTKGGWKTLPFIIGNESCEKLAVVGLLSNMVVYLTTKYNMEIVTAANIMSIWSGTTSFATLGGAFLADSYIGRYRTIVIGCLSYLVGMSLWTVSALAPGLRPSECSDLQKKLGKCESASKEQFLFIVMVFLFMSIGSAGIRPCNLAFGADQFQHEPGTTAPKGNKSVQSFFNWYYFANCGSVIVASTLIVYLQSNVNWSLGFGVCALLMFISTVIFISGAPIFRHDIPQGSPFTAIAQVIVASIKKRNLSVPTDSERLYHGQSSTVVPVTERFRFLNKAAIPTEGDIKADGSLARPWRLSSIHQIEGLKPVIGTLPIFSCLIGNAITSGQQSTFAVFQALTMDRRLGSTSFVVPAASIDVFVLLVIVTWIPLYDRLVVPAIRRVTKQDRGITPLQRMGVGYVISSMSMLVAGFVEVKRRNTARSHGLTDDPQAVVPISVFWLVPQFCIQGLASAFHAVGYLDFFYGEFPPNMRSTAIALSSCMYALGAYLSTFLVTLIHHTTGGNGKPDWLDNNLNRGRLHYFYWLLSVMEGLNILYFLFCASRYIYKENPVPDYAGLPKIVDGQEMQSKQITENMAEPTENMAEP